MSICEQARLEWQGAGCAGDDMDIKVPHTNKSVISDRRETSFASQLFFQLATSHQHRSQGMPAVFKMPLLRV